METKSSHMNKLFKTDGGKTKNNSIDIPTISLPKGGGAVRGIDEKFIVNTSNGTASFSVALPFSKARGVTPALTLSYNSGAGNGPFGLGWTINFPSVKRKTSQELPQYKDTLDTDTFLFSDAEDLVPAFKRLPDGSFEKDDQENYLYDERDSPDGAYTIRNYRPRVEGLFAQIERHMAKEQGQIRWKITTKDQITTLFGWTPLARIADPADERKIFQWLPELVFDNKGNCAHYLYKKENDAGFNSTDLHQQHRKKDGLLTYTNTYLETIYYGNTLPFAGTDQAWPTVSDYLFSTRFDYGEYKQEIPSEKVKEWDYRPDAFSDYRAGFEIRTTRLCKNILLFHHFREEGEYEGLVKSLHIDYDFITAENFTFLHSLTTVGYCKDQQGFYSQKALPPVVFQYRPHEWNRQGHTIAMEDLIHSPSGPEGAGYQFTDLFNEGLSGILTEQGTGWYYKHNLGNGHFAHASLISSKPSFSGLGESTQLADLDADGGKQLVSRGDTPMGFFEWNEERGWQGFRSFMEIPNISWNDPHLRMIDLNGDGKPDMLLSEDEVFTWYPSKGRQGYDAGIPLSKSSDEAVGPRVVFAEPTQTLFLADMSGDGLTDLVRIRNGEICYWPNMGYGKFGAKIQLDQAPLFDHPEAFSPSYVRLADIDGSGTADLIYLGKNKISIWKNLSGNRFSEAPFEIEAFPAINRQNNIALIDLMGNGVLCLVSTTADTTEAISSVYYIDLMNGKKPYLLSGYQNNTGKEVLIEYLPSTHFYLQDAKAGTPWETKLHFPVQCISKIHTTDQLSGAHYERSYAYHHGYYDHAEREFRGFAMVEQQDTELFDHWQEEQGSLQDRALQQDPVIIKTWFHAGTSHKEETSETNYQPGYWSPPNGEEPSAAIFQLSLDPSLAPMTLQEISTQEIREASRACKGMKLRTEIFAKDAIRAGNTPAAIQQERDPYSVEMKCYQVRLLQPCGQNKHAIFATNERESKTYHYDRQPDDPRITHQLNIRVDSYGNVLESASVAYPRRIADPGLSIAAQNEQQKTLIVYTEVQFTNDVIHDSTYLLRLPAEVKTYEWKDLAKEGLHYSLDDFNRAPQQRTLIEHTRTLYSRNDLTGPLPLYELAPLGFTWENYQLAYTPALLTDLFEDRIDDLLLEEGKFMKFSGEEDWWIRSGTKQFVQVGETVAAAKSRFYMPISHLDPYGALTKLTYYGHYHLMVQQTEDALGNISGVAQFNFRTMTPQRIYDSNANLSEVICDELGTVKALALMEKGEAADELFGIQEQTDAMEAALVQEFLHALDIGQLIDKAKALLQRATIRFVYDPNAYINDGKPVVVATISREVHFHRQANAPVQIAFEYSNGLGETLLKKVQAEQLRWLSSGRTVKNNKGNPVKQYEPYFSLNHQYEDAQSVAAVGVTSLLYYDAIGRLIKTEMPDGSFSKSEAKPWGNTVYDQNDTVLESRWYQRRTDPTDLEYINDAAQQLAAQQTAQHANTPLKEHFDVLGRTICTVEHHKNPDSGADEFFHTHLAFDIEGSLLQVADARNNKVMQYSYDLLGNKAYQKSMDSGKRWLFNSIFGKPLRVWDERQHELQYTYDLLQRPLTASVLGGDGDAPLNHIFSKNLYGDQLLLPDKSNLSDLQSKNLLGNIVKQYDTAGLLHMPHYDFKAKPIITNRRFFANYKETPNWIDDHLEAGLETEVFTFESETDALGRMVREVLPDGSIYRHQYNEGGLLNQLFVRYPGAAEEHLYIKDIDYDEQGRHTKIIYGNNVISQFHFDPQTFRLNRLQSKRQDQTILMDCLYTYDPMGHVLQIEDQAVPDTFFDNQQISATSHYVYDALYRLIKASGREKKQSLAPNEQGYWNDFTFMQEMNPGSAFDPSNYTQHYRYDVAGNIIQLKHEGNLLWNQDYHYEDLSNRLQYIQLANGNIPYSYHPEHGFFTAMPHLHHMRWNFRDELLSTSGQYRNDGGSPETTWYQYDGNGQRVRKITENQAAAGMVPSRKEERIYLGVYELYKQYSGPNAGLERKSLSLMHNGNRFAMVEIRNGVNDGTPPLLVRYQLHNHIGSTSLELDAAAQVIHYEEYHPFGSTAYQASNKTIKAAAKRYRYIGLERDEETGMGYHGARYYLPWLGRWASPDPGGISDGTNLYRYASNNPVSKFDSNGKWETDMHFGAVYITGRIAGATHAEALVAAIASQSLDDRPQTAAPDLKIEGLLNNPLRIPSMAPTLVQEGNNRHALGLTFKESQAVANEGIKRKDILMFGLGLHTVGDFLPHANLSGKGTVGHQEGQNEDGSESHWYMHDADWTYKNPSKALSTFKIFLDKWDQFKGNQKKTEFTAEQKSLIDKFIHAKADDWKGKVESFEAAAKAAGATDKEWAQIYKFFSQQDERVKSMERAYKLPQGKKSIDAAENMWRSQKENDNMINSTKTEVPHPYTPPDPPKKPDPAPGPVERFFGGWTFEIYRLYGAP